MGAAESLRERKLELAMKIALFLPALRDLTRDDVAHVAWVLSLLFGLVLDL